jgi:hypothetical protein
MSSHPALSNSWKVLALFMDPIGAGIPGGVLLARKYGLGWPVMMFLYFVSDVVMACCFEPMMHGFTAAGKRIPILAKIGAAMAESTRRTVNVYGEKGGPVALVLVAFGVDPMTARAAAAAAGHGFVAGWAMAIAGDMMYFAVLMASTLWLNSVLGDGTATMALVCLLMFVVPSVFKRWRERRAQAQGVRAA